MCRTHTVLAAGMLPVLWRCLTFIVGNVLAHFVVLCQICIAALLCMNTSGVACELSALQPKLSRLMLLWPHL